MTAGHRFVIDTMLGKLARWLRAMGYDALYFRGAEDRQLLQLARAEARTLLTRDARLARLAGDCGLLIQATLLEPQIAEVVERLALVPSSERLLSRCLECNALLEDRPKESVRGLVPEYAFRTQERFVGCSGCGRIYWQGSHADRMLERLGRVLGRGRTPGGLDFPGTRC
jgi:uncharacterized protein with PIN domain